MDMLQKVREWLDEEIKKGIKTIERPCKSCKVTGIHVYNGKMDYLTLWTCYSCGTTSNFSEK